MSLLHHYTNSSAFKFTVTNDTGVISKKIYCKKNSKKMLSEYIVMSLIMSP